jgi:hypothetical protein
MPNGPYLPFFLTHGPAQRLAVLTLLASLTAWSQEQRHGIHARSTPDDYSVSAPAAGMTIAASFIPPAQVRHLFAFDISGSYLVFEVACYPAKDASLQVDANGVAAEINRKGAIERSVDATTVAADVQRQHIPQPSARTGNVYTEADVGYHSGTDPYTGRRVSGVDYGGGVAVEHGGPDTGTRRYPDPGGLPEDRETLRGQLLEKGFPDGKFDRPVAGYVYFARSLVKKDSKGVYHLDYQTDGSAGPSVSITLAVPDKNR